MERSFEKILPVNLIKHQDRFDTLLPGLLKDNLGLRLDSLNHIHNYNGSITEPDSCAHLRGEVNVSW